MLARSIKSIQVTSSKVVARNFVSSNICSGTYSEEQAKKGRHVSPHVTIYKFPIAAITSIANRATGVALSVGIAGISGLALGGADVGAVVSSIGSIAVIGQTAKFAVAFPLVYHYLAGVRHILWDRNPDLLETEKVTQSSYVLAGTSTAISVILALV